jgi:hypothetical protein
LARRSRFSFLLSPCAPARTAGVDKHRRLRENVLMFERHYRRRLDADLLQWQANGTISAAVGDAIRQTLGPTPGVRSASPR